MQLLAKPKRGHKNTDLTRIERVLSETVQTVAWRFDPPARDVAVESFDSVDVFHEPGKVLEISPERVDLGGRFLQKSPRPSQH